MERTKIDWCDSTWNPAGPITGHEDYMLNFRDALAKGMKIAKEVE